MEQAPNPLYGRLDAVCDFTSARWQDSLRFMEPNLSGVGGIHMGPLAEALLMRDVVPTIQAHDPSLALELPRDQRDLFLQVLLDHASAIGRPSANICLIEPKYVAEGPNEQSHLVTYYRAQRGIDVRHADPRELRLADGEVYYEDTVVDVAYRDYEIRDLLALEREQGKPLDAIRALFAGNRIVSSIAGDLDHKSCFEILTDDALAARAFDAADRALFRRHVLWTRLVSERATQTPDGRADLPKFIRTHREELVLKPNRSYGGTGVLLGAAASQSEWERAARPCARERERSVRHLGRAVRGHVARASLPRARGRPEPRRAVLHGDGLRADGARARRHLSRLAEAGRERRAARRPRGRARRAPADRPQELGAQAGPPRASARRADRDDQEAPRSRRRDPAARVGRGDVPSRSAQPRLGPSSSRSSKA